MLDISALVRKDFGISNYLVEIDDSLIAKKPLKILFPLRFNQCGLADISDKTRCISVFAIINEKGEYMVCNIVSMMQLTPDTTTIEKYEDEEYYVLSFDQGSTVTPNVNLVVNDKNAYNIYKEFISRGKVPFYMGYEDLGKCLATAHDFAGIKLSGNNAVIELLVSTIARDSKDLHKQYRYTIKAIDEEKDKPPVFIPFTSVIYNTTSTMGKIMGGYFNEGLVSALTREAEEGSDGIETLLRQ